MDVPAQARESEFALPSPFSSVRLPLDSVMPTYIGEGDQLCLVYQFKSDSLLETLFINTPRNND
jgi:hypothetical protein